MQSNLSIWIRVCNALVTGSIALLAYYCIAVLIFLEDTRFFNADIPLIQRLGFIEIVSASLLARLAIAVVMLSLAFGYFYWQENLSKKLCRKFLES